MVKQTTVVRTQTLTVKPVLRVPILGDRDLAVSEAFNIFDFHARDNFLTSSKRLMVLSIFFRSLKRFIANGTNGRLESAQRSVVQVHELIQEQN